MAHTTPIKVIIVGGSVAGLTLANCLERADIDFVLLEKGSEIVYEGGASIGLMANGLRIMDQLDVFEEIRKTTEPLQATFHRTPDGASYASSSYMHSLEARHGYPSLFFEREELLKILHKRISDKSKVHTSKRVMKVKTSEDGVRVTTSDDAIYEGDIVVGADGVNSTVRRCMWAEMQTKNYDFTRRESTGNHTEPALYIYSTHENTDEYPLALFAEYCCIFGISIVTQSFEGFSPGISHVVYDKKVSLGAIMGINGKVFWFLFVKLGKKHYAPNIPRFTTADAEAMAARHQERRLTKDVIFNDLWTTRSRCTMVALEEGVCEKWYNERTVLLGDSAHKMTPNAGQGGNTAIESAATLTNLLRRTKMKDRVAPISTNQFAKLFEEYQMLQKPRADIMFEASTVLTRLQTRNSLGLTLFANYALPVLGDGFQVNVASALVLGGAKLDFVHKELKSGSIPWEGWSPWRRIPPLTSVLLAEVKNFSSLIISWACIKRISRYTFTNKVLLRFAAPAVTNSLQNTNFAMNLLPVVGISMIESLRINNQSSFAGLPAALGVAYQVGGPPLCASAYFLAHAFHVASSRREIQGGDIVNPAYAKTLSTALLTVYPLIALAASGLPHFSDSGTLLVSRIISRAEVWQSLPALLAITHYILACQAARHEAKCSDSKNIINGHGDLPSLRKTYLVLMLIPALFHLWIIGHAVIRGDLQRTIMNMWFPRGCWDYLLVFGTGLVWTLWNFTRTLQLRRVRANLKIAAIMISSSLLVGPGATMAALWGLREEALRAR